MNATTTTSTLTSNLYHSASEAITLAARILARAGHSATENSDLGTVLLDCERIADVLNRRGREETSHDAIRSAPFRLPYGTRPKVLKTLIDALPLMTLADAVQWCARRETPMRPPQTLQEWREAIVRAAQAAKMPYPCLTTIDATGSVPGSAASTTTTLPLPVSTSTGARREDGIDTISSEEREALTDDTGDPVYDGIRADDVGAGAKNGKELLNARRAECKARKLSGGGTSEDLLHRLRADDERRGERRKGVIAKSAPVIEVKSTKSAASTAPTTPVPVPSPSPAPVVPTTGIQWTQYGTANGSICFALSIDGQERGRMLRSLSTITGGFTFTLYVGGALVEIIGAKDEEERNETYTRAQLRLLALCGYKGEVSNLTPKTSTPTTPKQSETKQTPKQSPPGPVSFKGWTAEAVAALGGKRTPSGWEALAKSYNWAFVSVQVLLSAMKVARVEWEREQEALASKQREEETLIGMDDDEEEVEVSWEYNTPAPTTPKQSPKQTPAVALDMADTVRSALDKGTLGAMRRALDVLGIAYSREDQGTKLRTLLEGAINSPQSITPPSSSEAPSAKRAGQKTGREDHYKIPAPITLRDGLKDRERAKAIGLPIEHYRVLLALVTHETAMTYDEIESATKCSDKVDGYYSNLTKTLQPHKEGSLGAMGLTDTGRFPSDKGDKDVYKHFATLKGAKLIATAIAAIR